MRSGQRFGMHSLYVGSTIDCLLIRPSTNLILLFAMRSGVRLGMYSLYVFSTIELSHIIKRFIFCPASWYALTIGWFGHRLILCY